MFAGCPRQIYLQLGVGIQFTIPFCLLHHSRMYTCRLPLSLHSARLHFLSSWVCWPPVVTVIEGSQICVITRTGPVLRCATLYWENLQELVGFFFYYHTLELGGLFCGAQVVFFFLQISLWFSEFSSLQGCFISGKDTWQKGRLWWKMSFLSHGTLIFLLVLDTDHNWKNREFSLLHIKPDKDTFHYLVIIQSGTVKIPRVKDVGLVTHSIGMSMSIEHPNITR